MSTPYDRAFFDAQSARSLKAARIALLELFPYVRPKNVLDVGCGVGAWLKAADELGAAKRLGVDGDYVDRGALMMPADLFLPPDLTQRGLSEAVKR
jgi:predicted RNA methylase